MVVDLTGQLSNPCPELATWMRNANLQVRSGTDATSARRAKQRQVRLSDAQRAELVDRYRVGALQRELAAAYGVHVETVRAILKRSA